MATGDNEKAVFKARHLGMNITKPISNKTNKELVKTLKMKEKIMVGDM